MNAQNLHLKGGVIIIGSLLWQDNYKDKDNDKIRYDWRNKYLDLSSKILTRLPIRYGRYSSDNIYTMVFSTDCEKSSKSGTGFVVPFKRGYIDNMDDLISEAQMMSKAEGMDEKFIGGKNSSWASMGILVNRNRVQPDIYKIVLTKWSEKFKNDGGGKDISEYGVGKERRSISKNGELQIRWPKSIIPYEQPKIEGIDFLIATSTKPRHIDNNANKYPSVSEIVSSVENDSKRRYFLNNFQHTITTFQDNKVINLL
jgi:hypothetical protein